MIDESDTSSSPYLVHDVSRHDELHVTDGVEAGDSSMSHCRH